ncbi:unnamed protein product [Symbiodinium sp. CCMP2592]|nr:unnamed protein product [Symbiodinium sp. CCMP2592]
MTQDAPTTEAAELEVALKRSDAVSVEEELPPETLSERVRRVQQQWSLFRAGFWELCSTAAVPGDVESKDPANWAADVSEAVIRRSFDFATRSAEPQAVWHHGEVPKQTDFSVVA